MLIHRPSTSVVSAICHTLSDSLFPLALPHPLLFQTLIQAIDDSEREAKRRLLEQEANFREARAMFRPWSHS